MTNPEKTCSRKKKYFSFQRAYKDMQELKRKNPNEFFNVYLCSICKHYHVGHLPQKYEPIYYPSNDLFKKVCESVTPLKKKGKKVTKKENTFEKEMQNVTPLKFKNVISSHDEDLEFIFD